MAPEAEQIPQELEKVVTPSPPPHQHSNLPSRRWVVISKTHLLTYKNQDMKSTPTEAIILKLCRGVKSAEDITKKPFSFQVDMGAVIFYFHAETNEQKEKWIGVISKVPSQPSAILPSLASFILEINSP